MFFDGIAEKWDGWEDRAICYSVWPHFEARDGVARELGRILRPGGHLHVWHLIARAWLNEIHASAGEAVRGDLLPPAEETAGLLGDAGFEISVVQEQEGKYLVTGRKPER